MSWGCKGDRWAVLIKLFPSSCLTSRLEAFVCHQNWAHLRKENLEGWFPQGTVSLTLLTASSLPVASWNCSLKQLGVVVGGLCLKIWAIIPLVSRMPCMYMLTDMAYCVGPKAAHEDVNACFLGTHRWGLSIPGSGKRHDINSIGIRAWAAGLDVDSSHDHFLPAVCP